MLYHCNDLFLISDQVHNDRIDGYRYLFWDAVTTGNGSIAFKRLFDSQPTTCILDANPHTIGMELQVHKILLFSQMYYII